MAVSECLLDELLEVKEVFVVAKSLQLRCQLDDFKVRDAHFCQDFFDAHNRDLAWVLILFAQQAEGIFHVDFAELRV